MHLNINKYGFRLGGGGGGGRVGLKTGNNYSMCTALMQLFCKYCSTLRNTISSTPSIGNGECEAWLSL